MLVWEAQTWRRSSLDTRTEKQCFFIQKKWQKKSETLLRKKKAHHFHEFGIYMYVHGLYNALDGLIVVKTFGTDLCHTKIFS